MRVVETQAAIEVPRPQTPGSQNHRPPPLVMPKAALGPKPVTGRPPEQHKPRHKKPPVCGGGAKNPDENIGRGTCPPLFFQYLTTDYVYSTYPYNSKGYRSLTDPGA